MTRLIYKAMTSLDISALSKEGKSQLALTLATFVLHDAKIPINADNLNKVLKASNNDASDGLIRTFASVLEASPVDKFLKVGGGGAPAGAASAGAAKDNKAGKEEKKVEAKKAPEPEPEPDVDMDMGDLFG